MLNDALASFTARRADSLSIEMRESLHLRFFRSVYLIILCMVHLAYRKIECDHLVVLSVGKGACFGVLLKGFINMSIYRIDTHTVAIQP